MKEKIVRHIEPIWTYGPAGPRRFYPDLARWAPLGFALCSVRPLIPDGTTLVVVYEAR